MFKPWSGVVRSLRQYAPTWLVQLPDACTPMERKTLLREHSAVTPRRMLRELTDALDILTLSKPVVLLLEDLHWADAATLDWLAFVAARRASARLLLIGTSRSDAEAVCTHNISSLRRPTQRRPYISRRASITNRSGCPTNAMAEGTSSSNAWSPRNSWCRTPQKPQSSSTVK